MNKRGSMIVYGLMLALVVIILALALAPAGQTFIESSMNQTTGDTIGMNCSSTTISNFDKAGCAVVDFSVFYFFGGLMLIGGAIAVSRIVFA